MKAIGDVPLNQYLARVYRDAEALSTPSAALRKRYLDRLAPSGRRRSTPARAVGRQHEGGRKKKEPRRRLPAAQRSVH